MIVFALLVLQCSCASRNKVRPDAVSLEEREHIHQTLALYNEQKTRMKGLVGFSARGSSTKGSLRAAVLVNRPYHLRIDQMDETGHVFSQLSLVSGLFRIYWPDRREHIEGIANRDSLQEYLRLPLRPEVAIDLVLGRVLYIDRHDYENYKRLKDGRIEMKGVYGKLLVEKKGESYVPSMFASYGLEGEPEYSVFYTDFSNTTGQWFPGQVIIHFGRSRRRLAIHYIDVDLRARLEEGTFEVEIPKESTPVSDF